MCSKRHISMLFSFASISELYHHDVFLSMSLCSQHVCSCALFREKAKASDSRSVFPPVDMVNDTIRLFMSENTHRGPWIPCIYAPLLKELS